MHTPGAEAQFYGSSRAKAKALAYLDAKAYQMRKRYLDAKAPPPDAKALFDSEDLPFGSVKSWRLPWVRVRPPNNVLWQPLIRPREFEQDKAFISTGKYDRSSFVAI